MLSQQEIKDLLTPNLKQLEQERQAIKSQSDKHKTVLRVGGVVFFGAIGGIIALNTKMIGEQLDEEMKLGLIIALVVFGLSAFIAMALTGNKAEKLRQNFEATVKVNCYQPVFEAWKPTTAYFPQQKVAQSIIVDSQMVGNYNEYKGDDYCSGRLADGRQFQFSELELNQVTRDSEGSENRKNVFKGLFFVLEGVETFKDYPGRVTINSKKESKFSFKKIIGRPQNDTILDANFEPSTGSREHLRKIFEERYKVEGSSHYVDSEEALSDHFVTQVNGLTDIIKRPIRISFKEDKLYAMFWSTPDFWRVELERPLYNSVQLAKQVADFKLNFEFMDRLISATASPDLEVS